MTNFYLIRHAHTDFTYEEQRTLSEKGQTDAQSVADLLSRYPITQIFSSPFQRAFQTVQPLAKKLGLEIHIEPDLRERCLGDDPQGNDFQSMVQQAWQEPSYSFPGGESNRAAQHRGVRVIRQLMERFDGEHLVLSTHGNLLCLILQFYDQSINYDFWKKMTMPDVYSFLYLKEGMKITRIWLPLLGS